MTYTQKQIARNRLGQYVKGHKLVSGKNNGMYGKHHSKETKIKIGLAQIGNHHSQKTKGKMSLSHQSEKAYNWKGDKAEKTAIHKWIRKNKPKPELCEKCNKQEPRDVANVSGKYNRDISNYRWECHSCNIKEYWQDKMGIK